MRKHLKNTFIPHEGNDHKPHMLREVGVAVLTLLILASFAVSSFYAVTLVKHSDLIAAIFPSVLVNLTNEDRAETNLPVLSRSEVLTEAARLKAEDMAKNGYFAHTSPEGITPWHWFMEAGYVFTNAGENLAVNFVDSEDVNQAWLDSPGHRANILSSNFTEIGIATAEGQYKGRDTIFVVQLFGRPALSPLAQATSDQDISEAQPEVADASIEQEAQVVAESGEVVPVPEENLVVLEETDTFISVEDTGQTAPVEEPTVGGTEATGLVAQPDVSIWQRLLSQPRTLLEWAYIVLGALVLLVLTAMILVEVEVQHPRHIAYGVGLLVLMLVLLYINRTMILPELLIV